MAETQAKSVIHTKLYYKTAEASDFIQIPTVQEIPSMGGEKESIEVTTLADDTHIYIGGLKNLGDSLQFKLIYVKEEFQTLNALGDEIVNWKVELSDGATCTFSGSCSIVVDAIAVGNNAYTATLSVKPASEMTWG